MAECEEESQPIPVNLLIYPGSRKEKWLYYRKQITRYQRHLEEVAVFNPTIRNFIKFILSKLEHNSSENYAAALYQFYHDERLAEKLIANPTGLEHTFYQKYDHCVVSYVPQELPDGRFAVCQEHTTDSLQMLLKADYMTALNVGCNIRRCIVCKNYFLVRSGTHVLYCEGAVRWMSALPAGSMAAMRFRKNWHGMCQKSRPRPLPSTASGRIISGGSSRRRKCGG